MIRKLIPISAVALCAMSFHALALSFPRTVEVVEYRNAELNHYFLTSNPSEIASLDAAPATGWKRTGASFTAFDKTSDYCGGCVAVSRFYGTPGIGPSNQHFFTAFRDEAEGLKQPGSGWTYESDAFAVMLPNPDSNCAPKETPVYRFYNASTGHRYVVRDADRQAMGAEGWTAEGLAFCAGGITADVLQRITMQLPPTGRVLTGGGCDAIDSGGCIAVNNLSMPATPQVFSLNDQSLFTQRSGWPSLSAMNIFVDGSLAADASQLAFVQLPQIPLSPVIGVHVDTRSKLSHIPLSPVSPYSSVIPSYKLPAYNESLSTDPIVFPWAAGKSTQLAIGFEMLVKRIETRSPDSNAYGHTSVEFVDTRSGGRVLFNLLAYGTISTGEVAWRDDFTGKTTVGGPFRSGSPYGRSVSSSTLSTPPGFVNPAYYSGASLLYVLAILEFEFRIDRDEFGRVLDSARIANASLSPDPADYRIAGFSFKNEVVGDGEIGVTLGYYSLALLSR
jgi:hypothetical protein